jgi:hypothetical protein
VASDDTAPAGQHRSPRADIPLLAAGFGSGLIAMTFGPVLAVGLLLFCSFPIVPLVLAGVFRLLAVACKDRRLRCVANGLVAAGLFGIAGCAVFLIGVS